MENWICNILNNRFLGEWTDTQFFEAINNMLDDTGGKLYKYRRFDSSGHSLENLKNQVLYCAEPSSFNDPLDCRLRLDIGDVFKLQFPEFEPALENAMTELNNKLDIPPDTKSEDSPQLNSERITLKLKEMLPSFETALSGPLELVMRQAGYKEEEVPYEMLHEVINSPGLSMLISSNQELDGSDVLRAAYGIETEGDDFTLIKMLAQLKQPEKALELNDMERKLFEAEKKPREAIDQSFYVGCLAEKRDSVLMWSHYGESHTGFCIEYDFHKLCLYEKQLIILPTIYSDERPAFPLEALYANSDEDLKRAIVNFIRLLLSKDSAWSYEKVWRILRPSQQGNAVSLPIVSGVYLGANCSQENKEKILSITNQLQVPAYQMVVDRGKYKLHALPINL